MNLKDIDWENICKSKSCPIKTSPLAHTHCLNEKGMKERGRERCIICNIDTDAKDMIFKYETFIKGMITKGIHLIATLQCKCGESMNIVTHREIDTSKIIIITIR